MTQLTRDYRRTFEELEQVASKFWPSELSEIEAKLGIVSLLLETQDQFVSILSIEPRNLGKFFKILEAASLPANLFLKHMVVLAGFGEEMFPKIGCEFETLFPEGRLDYDWQGEQQSHTFMALPERGLSSKALHIDDRGLFVSRPLDDLQKDAIALLLLGNAYSDSNTEISSMLMKCHIGEYLGQPEILKMVVKQRYIWLSPIVMGSSQTI